MLRKQLPAIPVFSAVACLPVNTVASCQVPPESLREASVIQTEKCQSAQNSGIA